MEQTENNKGSIRIHRVGTVTLGCTLILAGILFGVHLFVPSFTYSMIFSWWPVIFILLGLEILVANMNKQVQFTYDPASVVMMILLTIFAMTMAGAEMIIQYAEQVRF